MKAKLTCIDVHAKIEFLESDKLHLIQMENWKKASHLINF